MSLLIPRQVVNFIVPGSTQTPATNERPTNVPFRLKKGCAYHYDLFVVGLLNVLLALYGLPMMHGVLPHSPLHVRSLADIEEQVEEGHLREV